MIKAGYFCSGIELGQQ